MRRICERLYTGAIEDCFEGAGEWAVVHACRHPCYRAAVQRLGLGGGSPACLEADRNLYLDLIDAPARHFSTPPLEAFLSFASRHWEGGAAILIHCNQGMSRSPSLAMLLLAKRLGTIPGASYEAASAAFSKLLPCYFPGEGIRAFLSQGWHRL